MAIIKKRRQKWGKRILTDPAVPSFLFFQRVLNPCTPSKRPSNPLSFILTIHAPRLWVDSTPMWGKLSLSLSHSHSLPLSLPRRLSDQRPRSLCVQNHPPSLSSSLSVAALVTRTRNILLAVAMLEDNALCFETERQREREDECQPCVCFASHTIYAHVVSLWLLPCWSFKRGPWVTICLCWIANYSFWRSKCLIKLILTDSFDYVIYICNSV
jgi:hypothetical protein